MDFHCSFLPTPEWLRLVHTWLCIMEAVSKVDQPTTQTKSNFMLKCEASQNLQPRSAQQGRPPDLQPRHLRLDDLYELAESARLHSSLLSRRCAVQQAQNLLQLERKMPRPSGDTRCHSQMSPLDQFVSRPHSAAPCFDQVLPHCGRVPGLTSRLTPVTSGDLGSLDPEDNVDFSPGYVRRVEISVKDHPCAAGFACDHRSNSTFFRLKPESADQETMSNGRLTSVALECYDLMGPSVCRERQAVRSAKPSQQQTTFLELDACQRNAGFCALVQRLYPEMTQAEIQHKLLHRQVAATALISSRFRPVCTRDDPDPDCCQVGDLADLSTHGGSRKRGCEAGCSAEGREGGCGSVRDGHGCWTNGEATDASKTATCQSSVVLSGQPSTPLFFSSLKHMNSKIYRGQAVRSLGSSRREERDRSGVSAASALSPAFVSPRKARLTEDSRCHGVFGPPLLAKDRQVANPSFFAGSDVPYSLPARLPDLLVFTKGISTASIADPTPTFFRSTSASFTSGGHNKGPVST